MMNRLLLILLAPFILASIIILFLTIKLDNIYAKNCNHESRNGY